MPAELDALFLRLDFPTRMTNNTTSVTQSQPCPVAHLVSGTHAGKSILTYYEVGRAFGCLPLRIILFPFIYFVDVHVFPQAPTVVVWTVHLGPYQGVFNTSFLIHEVFDKLTINLLDALHPHATLRLCRYNGPVLSINAAKAHGLCKKHSSPCIDKHCSSIGINNLA